MNEHLVERFGRSRPGTKQRTIQVEVRVEPPKRNEKVQEYFKGAQQPADASPWLRLPAIPSSAEVLDLDIGDGSHSTSNVEIAVNKPTGAWASKGEH